VRNARSILLVVVLAWALAGGCSSRSEDGDGSSALHDDAITVASFDFAESELLAELYSQALEAQGYEVQRVFHVGPRELVAPALARGLVEVVPEYAGTALQFFTLGATPSSPDARITHDALVDALRQRPIRVLAGSPAEDANAFAVRKETADAEGLTKVSDLAAIAPRLVFGGPPECPQRPHCLPGLRDTYGLTFKGAVTLDAGGELTRQALREGDVDVALLFTTDPTVNGTPFVALEDDRKLQPAENVTPLVRSEVVDRWGSAVTDALDAVSQALTTDELRRLNTEVAQDPDRLVEIARSWLLEQSAS
jgi:osmoprotectant transport system substrate-binding protein